MNPPRCIPPRPPPIFLLPPRARSMSATRANSRCPTWRYIPGRFIVGTTGSAPSAAVLAASIAFARPATPIPPHHTRPAGHHPIGQCRDAAGRDGEHLSLSLSFSFLFIAHARTRPRPFLLVALATSSHPPYIPRPTQNATDEHGSLSKKEARARPRRQRLHRLAHRPIVDRRRPRGHRG